MKRRDFKGTHWMQTGRLPGRRGDMFIPKRQVHEVDPLLPLWSDGRK